MEIKEHKWYYTPQSKLYHEAWTYVQSVGNVNAEWLAFISEDAVLRIVDEKLHLEVAADGLLPLTSQKAIELIGLIFKFKIEDDAYFMQ